MGRTCEILHRQKVELRTPDWRGSNNTCCRITQDNYFSELVLKIQPTVSKLKCNQTNVARCYAGETVAGQPDSPELIKSTE